MQTLTTAIQAAGGTQAEFARRIGVRAQVVQQWRTGQRPIPPERCHAIETAAGGEVSCEQLRPDLEWVTLPDGRKVSAGPAKRAINE
jgi:DNA-binding transcriptional regulator YdaS (Cro superfamily)